MVNNVSSNYDNITINTTCIYKQKHQQQKNSTKQSEGKLRISLYG